jgi:hypothetical protein
MSGFGVGNPARKNGFMVIKVGLGVWGGGEEVCLATLWWERRAPARLLRVLAPLHWAELELSAPFVQNEIR